MTIFFKSKCKKCCSSLKTSLFFHVKVSCRFNIHNTLPLFEDLVFEIIMCEFNDNSNDSNIMLNMNGNYIICKFEETNANQTTSSELLKAKLLLVTNRYGNGISSLNVCVCVLYELCYNYYGIIVIIVIYILGVVNENQSYEQIIMGFQ